MECLTAKFIEAEAKNVKDPEGLFTQSQKEALVVRYYQSLNNEMATYSSSQVKKLCTQLLQKTQKHGYKVPISSAKRTNRSYSMV